MTHTYYRCSGCGGVNYRESTITKHVRICKENAEGRYVVVREEVKQVEEREKV